VAISAQIEFEMGITGDPDCVGIGFGAKKEKKKKGKGREKKPFES